MHFLARIVLLLAGLSLIPIPSSFAAPTARVSPLSRSDMQQGVAASRIAAHSPWGAVTWLRRRAGVSRALLERDGKTLQIQFRDGSQLYIVPRTIRRVGIPTHVLPRLHQLARPRAGSAPGRAIALEPFANELNLGPDAGQREIDTLTNAGFKVDVARNGAVTVSSMEKLSLYSFVYMETHSGLLGNGDAIVVTGETDTAPYASLLAEGSVQQALVAGDTTGSLYLAIDDKFVTQHMGVFPNSSMVFLNGCSVLPATAFWAALQKKNVSTMIAWDNDVYNSVDELAADAVLSDMAKGDSVTGGIAAAVAAGYGTSTVQGVLAHLGLQGDGSNTFSRALSGQTPLTTPTAGPTPKTVKCTRDYRIVQGKCLRIAHHKPGHR